MDNVKKNIKRIWNSKCKYLVIVACALILANGINSLQAGLKFINSDGIEQEERKSIEITSSGWENKGPGSFQVTKSVDWTGIRKATIKFDVETSGLTGHTERDIILVLDNSGSMVGRVNGKQKLAQLQSDTTELIKFLLTEEGTRIAVINFNTNATLLSEFTSDSRKLISVVNSLKPIGGTSYTKAYQTVIKLLASYEYDLNRDLVMLFLTDGQALAASAEYQILKDRYHIQICGIQYELGSSIKQSIIDSSDVQYAANVINLKDIFFESIGVESYEEFEITDYITKEFSVENISDIRVSRGVVKLESDSDGKQKVIWQIPTSEVKFITSFSAMMEIDVVYKGELDPDRVYPTNEKEKIKVKLPDSSSSSDPEIIESEEVPRIRGGYYVTYDPNLPSECNSSGKDMTVRKSYFPYELADSIQNQYTCSGWQIKGWNFDEETELNITISSDNKFIMPTHDVKLTAIWTKVDISKGMDGEVAKLATRDLFGAIKENGGKTVSIDTGINFGDVSSSSNGRGLYIRSETQNDVNPIYYYRGVVENNHVLFAGICWQIVRTTESGGIKLIYNGVSSDGKTCKSTGDTHIGTSAFSGKGYMSGAASPAYVGYMKGDIYSTDTFITSKYIYGNRVYYSSKKGYELSYTTSSTKTPETGYHYTCLSTSKTKTCSPVYYAYRFEGSIPIAYSLSGGETIETAIENMFKNNEDSVVKVFIDNWYKTNIGDKDYTKYLDQNTVWCNDRTLTGGGIVSRDATFGVTTFAAYGARHLNSTSANPAVKETVACSRSTDRFTTNSANTGNGVLTYPVGMLTADEVVLAGLAYKSDNASQDSYLYKGYDYWTMTPIMGGHNGDSADYAYNAYVSEGGYWDMYQTTSSINIRPTISLKADTLVYDDGISGSLEHPYVVVME